MEHVEVMSFQPILQMMIIRVCVYHNGMHLYVKMCPMFICLPPLFIVKLNVERQRPSTHWRVRRRGAYESGREEAVKSNAWRKYCKRRMWKASQREFKHSPCRHCHCRTLWRLPDLHFTRTVTRYTHKVPHNCLRLMNNFTKYR